MKSKSPRKLYKEQMEKLKRLFKYNKIKNQITYVSSNATAEEYMAAYKKNRRLWKISRGVIPGQSRVNQMKSLKITVKDKRILKEYGYTDLSFLKNHYEAKCLIDKLKEKEK